jgi:predicted ATPase
LVGKNNSGKTSVLEALYLLAANGDPAALWRVLTRRGEQSEQNVRVGREEPEVDVSHLFHGHELRVGAAIDLSTKNSSPDSRLEFVVREYKPEDKPNEPQGQRRVEPPTPRMVIGVNGSPKPSVRAIALTRRGGMSSDILDVARRPSGRPQNEAQRPAQYITTESLGADELAQMWNDISLTTSEDRVLEALRFIEPDVERIAPIVPSSGYFYGYISRGGFRVKLKASALPIPIGSLGDGIWRMLAMAMALIRAKDGVLLIDEIDTGLHYTVMADMWKLIFATARDSNVQVFATTHSYDCIHSLATICSADIETNSRVTIQRIESGKKNAIPYSEAEIKEAAKRHIEVR